MTDRLQPRDSPNPSIPERWNVRLARFLKSPILWVIVWIGIGAWWGGTSFSNYLEKPRWSSLLIAIAYALFGIAMGVTTYVTAAANVQRFTKRQVLAARLLPFVPLVVVFVTLSLR